MRKCAGSSGDRSADGRCHPAAVAKAGRMSRSPTVLRLRVQGETGMRKPVGHTHKATRMRWDRFVASVLACSVLLSGCTSMKRIQPATAPGQPVYGPLQPGDTVVVYTSGGEQGPFVVDRIDGDTIVARGGTRFTRQDIVRLERRALSGPKT